MSEEKAEDKIKMYDNIEAPIVPFIKCQKFGLMNSAIGSDIGAFAARFAMLRMLINQGKKADAMKELRNQEHLFWHCIQEVSPDLLSFAALVKEIEGEKVVIESDEDVYNTAEKLKKLGVTKELIMGNEPKKKINDEMELAFPEAKTGFELFTAQKRMVMIEQDEVIDGKDYSDRKFSQEKIIADHTRILSFDGKEAAHIKLENEFHLICALLDTEINRPSKTLSIREWYLQKKLYHDKYSKAA